MRDLSLAFRALLKTPVFTMIAVVTLALGIGLNTSMFSLANVMLLRPLAFANPGSLVRLYRSTPEEHYGGFSPADYLDLKSAAPAFGQFSAYTGDNVSLSEPGRPAELRECMRVSADYFDTLGVRPQVGRAFRQEEEDFGNHRVAVLSQALWQGRYAGDPAVVGRSIRIDGESYEVIGILPDWASDDRLIRQVAIFRPLGFSAAERSARDHQWLSILGRRGGSVSVAQGESFVSAFGKNLAAAHPKEDGGTSWRCEGLLGHTGNPGGEIVVAMLLGLSGLVLLIACMNLANFLLARAISRSRELAVRAALGASRLDLVRPMAVESLVLAGIGCIGALFVAIWAAGWLSAQSVASGGEPMAFPLDWRVLGFAIGASLVTALAFSIAPAWFTTRVDVSHALKASGRGSSPGPGHQRLRRLLVIGQFAMAMTLLAGAGYFARSASHLLRQHVGWDSEGVVVGAFDLPASKYPGSDKILAFHREVIERLERLPGVEAVSLSYSLPYIGFVGPRPYIVEGLQRPAKGQEPSAAYNGITPDYFKVTGTRLLGGRSFNAADTAAAPPVVIINESMARALFPNSNPIGRRISRADIEKPSWSQVVGVVSDVRTTGIGYQRPVPFQLYHPLDQEPWNYATFAVRTGGIDPKSLLETIPAAITALDPDLAVQDLMPASKRVERSAFEVFMLTKMLGAFALLGLLLAALGIYGVMERAVVQRTVEIGIRIALGAQVGDVNRLIVGSGVRLALIGAGFGLVGAFGLSRLIASIYPALETGGGLVLAGATAVLMLIALIACYIPARGVSKIDPLAALRAE